MVGRFEFVAGETLRSVPTSAALVLIVVGRGKWNHNQKSPHAPKQEIGDDLFWEGRDVRNKLGEFDLGSELKLRCAFIIKPEGRE